MLKRKGKFIVLEGTDGSGKTTQFRELLKHFESEGVDVVTFDFPQYAKESSYFVKEYLNGKYGGAAEMGAYLPSIFYAVDRFDASAKLRELLQAGKVVLSNRYTASSMGHQGGKIRDRAKRKKYFKWLDELEYGVLGIPRPDMTIVLHVPAKMAQALVDKKGSREYIGGIKRDIHEADIAHLKQAETTYLEMVKMFPKDFKLVECVERGSLLSIPEIHKKIWGVVRKVVRL